METVKVGPVSVSQLNNYLKQRLDKDEALRLVCVEGGFPTSLITPLGTCIFP